MLSIYFHNDGSSPDNETGNYDVFTKINTELIYTGHLEGHVRGDWRDLIIEFACQLELEQSKENKNV